MTHPRRIWRLTAALPLIIALTIGTIAIAQSVNPRTELEAGLIDLDQAQAELESAENHFRAALAALPTSTTTTTLPPTTSTTTTTTIPPTTTTPTTLPPTTTSTIPAGQSYVNPINTGAEGSLALYNGTRNFTSGTTLIENAIVRGEVRVCGSANVTFRNVRWESTSTVVGGRAFQVDGGGSCTGSPRLTLDHVTIFGDGDTQRGISSQRGGVAQAFFVNVSGVEDCANFSSGNAATPNIFQDSYCHDMASPNSGPHYDGVQIMGGHARIHRNVFEVPTGATAAIFPKSEGSAVNVVATFNWAAGGTYTIRFGDGSNNTTTGTYTDNEVLNHSWQYGAYLAPQLGATATTARNQIVDWDIGEPGWHPGPQS